MENNLFHEKYIRSLNELEYEEYLYNIFNNVKLILNSRLSNSKRKTYDEDVLIDYVIQEFIFLKNDYQKEYFDILIKESFFTTNLVNSIGDKYFFNEMNQYTALSLLSKQSPVISTIDLFINFILIVVLLLQLFLRLFL